MQSASRSNSLFLSTAEWARLPLKLADPFFARLLEGNAKAIRAYDEQRGRTFDNLPVDFGAPGGARHNGNCRPLKGRLLRAAVALHAGGDESAWEFASRSIDFLLNPDFWCPVAKGCRINHFDLKMGDLLFCAAFVLDTFSDRLDPGRRQQLVDLAITKGLGAYLAGWEAEEWWRAADFNWSPAVHGNAGLAALSIASLEPCLSEEILAKVREGLRPLIANLPLDGWWTEGSMYQTTTLGHLSDFVIALYRTCGDDLGLSSNPRWLEGIDSRRECLAPDGRPFNFSNCSAYTQGWFCPHLYWWAEHLGRPEWITFEDSILKSWADVFGVFHDIEAFMYRPIVTDPAPLPPPSPVKHFRGLDWLIWRGQETWLAFRAGNNGGNHNNFDLGHFIMGRGRTRYLVDPGYGVTRTAGHNTVSIHGRDQTEGACAPILAWGNLPDGFFLSCDLSACQPFILDKHLRVLLVLDDEHLLVIDSLAGRKGQRVGSAYHFVTDQAVVALENGYRLDGKAGSLAITALFPTISPILDHLDSMDGRVTRMTFQMDADRTRELSAFLLSFAPTDVMPPPCVTANGDSLEVAWAGSRLTVDLTAGTVR